MKNVEIYLPNERVFSINHTYSRDMRFKTIAYKDWHLRLNTILTGKKQLHEMADFWRKEGGVFEVYLTAYYPVASFYNSIGAINARTIDCSNFEKVLIDIIFGDVMDVNDRQIVMLCSEKKPSEHGYGIKITINHEKAPL